MSTTLYLVRHGQSLGNLRHAFLGHTDLELTELGHSQAKRTAAFLADKKPDVIYASDLLRAYQTAEATAELLKMPIQKEPMLREIYAGAWENRIFEELAVSFPESFGVWREDIGNAHPDGGESVLELQSRVVKAITRLAEENDGRTVFLFTHATPIRTFSAYVMGKGKDEIKELPWAPNASVTKCTYEGGKFTMIEYGRDDFMGDMSTHLPSSV